MAVEGSFGAKVKIDVAATPTAIAHLNDVDGVTLRKTVVEATGHDAAEGYAEFHDSGKRSIAPIKLTLSWDKADATHAALVAGFNSKDPVTFTVEDPGGTEAIAFDAHITEMGRQYKQVDIYKCQVTIQPTGKPTITPAA